MKHYSYQELVTRLINLSVRDKSKPISITFSGEQAYTNTNSANIPALPAGTILTPNQFAIWLGYGLHEGWGHQAHTDLDAYENACRKRNNPKFSYILNLLEDIRIENADIALYPGDRKYLDATHTFVDSKIPLKHCQNPDLMGLIYKQLFVVHRNLDTNRIQGTLDPETSLLISEIDLCTSTQDCIDLADKVVDYLKTQPQSQQGQNQNNKNGEGENQEDNNNNGNGNDDNSSPHPSYTPTHQNPKSQNSNQFEFWKELTEIKNLVKELKDQIIKNDDRSPPDQNLDNKAIFPPANILNDRIYVPSRENLARYTSTRASATSQILALKKMFRIYLQAQTKKSIIRGLEDGKLDSHRLHVVSTGSNLIFKDSSHKLLPETAVELMIDMSGSMNADIARTSAIILAEALASIPQIKLSISGFTTNSRGLDYSYNFSPNSGRQIGMDILQFKDFSEPYQKARAKLGAITNTGNTPLGDAYGHAFSHIISRPETRKIIFLITDGHPEFPQGINHSDFLLMKKIHADTKKFKVQTLALGIGRDLDFLKNYFDTYINITKTQDLPQNLLSALKFFI